MLRKRSLEEKVKNEIQKSAIRVNDGVRIIMKFILLAGLIPVILSFLARKFFFERVVKREGGALVSLNGQQLAEEILKKGKAGSVDLTVKKRSFVKLGPTHLVLSPEQATSKKGECVAEAALLAGMVLMAQQQEKVVGWRTWALKFSWAMPAFTSVVLAFALVTRGLSASWCLGVLAAVLGLSTVLLWLTLPVEKAAAKTVAEMLEETALIPRRNEAERLAILVRAMPWRRIIPGAVAWIGRK